MPVHKLAIQPTPNPQQNSLYEEGTQPYRLDPFNEQRVAPSFNPFLLDVVAVGDDQKTSHDNHHCRCENPPFLHLNLLEGF